jgi:hypothetical protein
MNVERPSPQTSGAMCANIASTHTAGGGVTQPPNAPMEVTVDRPDDHNWALSLGSENPSARARINTGLCGGPSKAAQQQIVRECSGERRGCADKDNCVGRIATYAISESRIQCHNQCDDSDWWAIEIFGVAFADVELACASENFLNCLGNMLGDPAVCCGDEDLILAKKHALGNYLGTMVAQYFDNRFPFMRQHIIGMFFENDLESLDLLKQATSCVTITV